MYLTPWQPKRALHSCIHSSTYRPVLTIHFSLMCHQSIICTFVHWWSHLAVGCLNTHENSTSDTRIRNPFEFIPSQISLHDLLSMMSWGCLAHLLLGTNLMLKVAYHRPMNSSMGGVGGPCRAQINSNTVMHGYKQGGETIEELGNDEQQDNK